MDVSCIFVIDLVPSNAGKPLVVLKGFAIPGVLVGLETKVLGYNLT
jgi:hypothetical protein